MVVLEGWRAVARPQLIPDLLRVGSAGTNKPLRVVVERNLWVSVSKLGS